MTLWSSRRRRRVIEGNRNTGPCMTSLPVMETSGLRTRLWTHGGAVPFLDHLGGPDVIKSLLLDHTPQPQPHGLPQKDILAVRKKRAWSQVQCGPSPTKGPECIPDRHWSGGQGLVTWHVQGPSECTSCLFLGSGISP